MINMVSNHPEYFDDNLLENIFRVVLAIIFQKMIDIIEKRNKIFLIKYIQKN